MDEKIIKSFKIYSYRGIKNLDVNDLDRINIFVGKNNCGKSSILEALKIFSCPEDTALLYRTATVRRPFNMKKRMEYFLTIFNNTYENNINENNNINPVDMELTTNKVTLKYSLDATLTKMLYDHSFSKICIGAIKLNYSNSSKPYYYEFKIDNNNKIRFNYEEYNSLYNAIFMHSNVNPYLASVSFLSDVIIEESKEELLYILKDFDNNIFDISIVGTDIYIHNKITGTLPLFTYGSGMQKALLLAAVVIKSKNGIVLIDEIENAINISAFNKLFNWFVECCVKYNIQAFVTTHSLEALDTILKQKNYLESIRIITLRKNNITEEVNAHIKNGNAAKNEREEYGLELRL